MLEFLSTLGICEGASAALGFVTNKIMDDDKSSKYRIPANHKYNVFGDTDFLRKNGPEILENLLKMDFKRQFDTLYDALGNTAVYILVRMM